MLHDSLRMLRCWTKESQTTCCSLNQAVHAPARRRIGPHTDPASRDFVRMFLKNFGRGASSTSGGRFAARATWRGDCRLATPRRAGRHRPFGENIHQARRDRRLNAFHSSASRPQARKRPPNVWLRGRSYQQTRDAYARRRRAVATSPTKPSPSRASEAGSGTARKSTRRLWPAGEKPSPTIPPPNGEF